MRETGVAMRLDRPDRRHCGADGVLRSVNYRRATAETLGPGRSHNIRPTPTHKRDAISLILNIPSKIPSSPREHRDSPHLPAPCPSPPEDGGKPSRINNSQGFVFFDSQLNYQETNRTKAVSSQTQSTRPAGTGMAAAAIVTSGPVLRKYSRHR